MLPDWKPGELVYIGDIAEITGAMMYNGKDVDNNKIAILLFDSDLKPGVNMFMAFSSKEEGRMYFQNLTKTLDEVWPDISE